VSRSPLTRVAPAGREESAGEERAASTGLGGTTTPGTKRCVNVLGTRTQPQYSRGRKDAELRVLSREPSEDPLIRQTECGSEESDDKPEIGIGQLAILPVAWEIGSCCHKRAKQRAVLHPITQTLWHCTIKVCCELRKLDRAVSAQSQRERHRVMAMRPAPHYQPKKQHTPRPVLRRCFLLLQDGIGCLCAQRVPHIAGVSGLRCSTSHFGPSADAAARANRQLRSKDQFESRARTFATASVREGYQAQPTR